MASALLASRKVTYSAGLELTQLQADAAKIQGILRGAFEGLKIDGSKLFDTKSLEQASKQAQSVLLQQAQQQKAVAQTALQAERTQTQEARAQAQERISIAKAEEQERIQAAKAAATQIIEQEKRATEAQRQQRPTQQGSTLTGIGGSIGTAVTVGASVLVARQVLEQVKALDELRTQALRSNVALTQLAGGATRAREVLQAVQTASRGTVDTLQAQQIAVQGLALNLAKTPAEFEKLVRAAKQITIISPTIKDVGQALTELSLFSANEKSFARADQLGVSAAEVKDKMKELQAQDESLTDSQAKLAATMALLEGKIGGTSDAAEAGASGIERLTTSVSNLRIAIATSFVGSAADSFLAGIGGGIDTLTNTTEQAALKWRVIFGVDDLKSNVELVKNLLAGNDLSTSLDRFVGKLTGNEVNGEALNKFIQVANNYNKAIESGIPGLKDYQSVLESIGKEATGGNLSNESIVALDALNTSIDQAIKRFDSLKEAKKAALAPEVADSIQSNLENTITQSAAKAAPTIGRDRALEFQKNALDRVQAFIESLAQIPPAQIPLEVEIQSDKIAAQLDDIAKQTQDAIGKNTAIELGDSAARGIEALSSSFVDLSPALSSARTELIGLATDIATSGTATQEQANRQAELLAVTDALSGTTSAYAALQDAQGQALLASNQYANDLVTQMVLLDAAQASGKISTEQHAGAMSVLIAQLIAVAQQAGITGSALASLKAIQSGLPTSGGLGFTSGQRTGTNVNSLLQANEGARQREESRRAAERAAREQESAAKRAGKELESAAKRAGNELNSALQSVPGLFSASKVTQDQIDSAKAGIPQNFADDFLRRLRDVADNGTKRNDVSLDQARQALQNIGINPSDDVKQLVRQIEEAWNNSSLFASKDNLALINKEAVDANLALQEKMKQGKQNIQEFFGVVIDDATGAVSGVAKDKTDTEKLKQAVTDGKQKLVDDLTGTVKNAVDGATSGATATGGGVGTGTISGATFAPGAISFDGVTIPPLPISAVIFPPDVLKNVFTGVEIPAIKVSSIGIADGAGQAVVTGLATQLVEKTPDFISQGQSIGLALKLGVSGAKLDGIADSFATAIDTQFAAQSQKLATLGATAIGNVAGGAVTAVLPDMGASFLGAMATQFAAKTPDFVFNGGQVATAVASGFTTYYNTAATQTGMADSFRIAFGTQVQATRDKFTAQGDALAGIIDSGFIGHWAGASAAGAKADTSLSDAFLTKLQTQFGSGDSLTAYETIGSNIGTILGNGFSGYDFTAVAASAIAGIQNGFRSEENLTAIYNSGGALANTLHDGFIATVNQATWIADVKDAIVAEVLSDLAAGAEKKK